MIQMHTEIGRKNALANRWIGKLHAQLNVLYSTFQADPQFLWKLLNYYITRGKSFAGNPYQAILINGTQCHIHGKLSIIRSDK